MAAPRVVVAGALANKPANGGEAWVRLNWIRGLQRLGCDVWFVEQIRSDHLVDELGRHAPFAESANARWFEVVTGEFGLGDRAWLLCSTGEWLGPRQLSPLDVADGALLVNISGHLRGAIRAGFRRQAFVDIDPGFTQIWASQGNPDVGLDGHDCFFTIGVNIGTGACPIPDLGLAWHPVRPPVVLSDWPVVDGRDRESRFTTVATWRGPFGPVELAGRQLGLKVHQFRRFLELPRRVDSVFEAALAIDAAEVPDLEALDRNGWHLVEPRRVAGSPTAFRDYVSGSTAEFSPAQGVYVETASGWFSDRSAAYMAAGRPVLIQDTGFSSSLPVGDGLIAFATLDEAVAGANAILSDPDHHARAARKLATEYFDSDVVLAEFVDRSGAA
jgi:hypothetical protein